MDEKIQTRTASFWNSSTFKIIIIGLLIIALLIPGAMIKNLVRERETILEVARGDIISSWAEAQFLSGPILVIPYGEFTKKNNEIIEIKKYAYFLPEEINISGEINPEIRYRGIYKTILYNAALSISGYFTQPVLTDLDIKESDIYWSEAFILVGVSDMRGIQNPVMIKWNNNGRYVNPGILTDEVVPSGFHIGVEVMGSYTYRFEFDLDINGSETLNFTPTGKQTLVNLHSDWKNPGFEGAFLPDERVIDENGFEAKWKILNLNRNYPQKWTGAKYSIEESAFGVRLILPVDQYQKTMRSVKYAIMFIALTFMVFFFFEILNKYRIHPIQYLLIGLALCVFYILLLSLSEHIGFNLAYLIGSISIIIMITVYSISILKKVGRSIILTGILGVLYAFLYTLIQLQDYSLLIGSIGLFVTLAAIMYFSRNIDWYQPLVEDLAGKKKIGF